MKDSDLNPIETGLATLPRYFGPRSAALYAILSHQKQAIDDRMAKIYSLFVHRNGNRPF
jgi:hypothetical protein